MALGRENPHDVVPGLVTDGYNEQNQRGMYRRWAELMDAKSWDEIPPKRAKRGARNGGMRHHGK
jgi:ethylbenzene dioxygenase alpha subunit